MKNTVKLRLTMLSLFLSVMAFVYGWNVSPALATHLSQHTISDIQSIFCADDAVAINFSDLSSVDMPYTLTAPNKLRYFVGTNSTDPTKEDVMKGTDKNDTMIGYGGNDIFCGFGGADTISGGDGDDIIVGGDGPDKLIGDGGNDYLEGDAGNDTLSAGSDNDILIGGDGNDICSGGSGTDANPSSPTSDCETQSSIP